ncbi:MAG: hypothetical protein WD045_11770, partial [Pirellulaceae bacterium]
FESFCRMSLQPTVVQLVASGDSRLSANQRCWPAQQEMERKLQSAVEKLGYRPRRVHEVTHDGHGFIDSQKRGIEVFRSIDPDAPLIVAEAVWQYTHHVLAGLLSHRGPILTVANWSGQWPGLVGMLNLNGSLTKAGVRYSTLWSEGFTDDYFTEKLRTWLETGHCTHATDHVRPLNLNAIPAEPRDLGRKLADGLRREKAILGVFDEGCMGMFNAISAMLGAVAAGQYPTLLSAMAAMSGAGQVLTPDITTTTYHQAKYDVFRQLHTDQQAYRERMQLGVIAGSP